MVAAIRFWLKAFGLIENDNPTELAHLIFSDNGGVDRFLEDSNTLWILHYKLITTGAASIYHLLFLDFQREHKEFSRDTLLQFIRRKCSVPEQKNVYNENTVKKDINVLLQTYVSPLTLKSIEDFSALLIGLNLIQAEDKESKEMIYNFSEIHCDAIALEIILFALIDLKGEDNTVSFDKLKELSLIYCMPLSELIEVIRRIEALGKYGIHYTDNSGIKNVQFTQTISKFNVLRDYYRAI